MLLEVCEVLTEWVCVMTCAHTLSGEKPTRKHSALLLLFVYVSVAIVSRYWTKNLKILAYIAILFYLYQLNIEWRKTIAIYGQLILIIPLGQLTGYFLFANLIGVSNRVVVGICSNVLLCGFLILLKNRSTWLYRNISRFKGAIICGGAVILLFSVLQLYNANETLQGNVVNIFFVSAVCMVILIAIWMHVEYEKETKERELKIHELYNQSFRNIIANVRRHQHEFDNQIAALQGLHYSASDSSFIIKMQNQYIEEIKKERVPVCLLSTYIHPVIAGFLYTKYLAAKEKHISMGFKVTGKTMEHIPVYEQIEIFGILVDNAIEALATSGKTKMDVMILQSGDNTEYIVMNQSETMKNSDLEGFFKEGFTSKGNGRGIGLSRLKEIAEEWNLQIGVGNRLKEGENYLEFKIIY